MAETLPVRKYIKVWIKKRKNNPRKDSTCSVSYTLEWVEYGQRRFMSLGKHATLTFARQTSAQKEKELNSVEHQEALVPITWDDFVKKYMDTTYPGRTLPLAERKVAERQWEKSRNTMRREKLGMDSFARLIKPYWCHEVTAEDRQKFLNLRLPEVASAASVDVELRTLRMLFNLMEEWKHRPESSNPFAGKNKATVNSRRRRAKERQQAEQNKAKPKHYTIAQLVAILEQADKEVADEPTWEKRRLRALVYFAAYTGARIDEILHVEWKDIDWDNGIVQLYFKIDNDLKTDGSEAPFGMPDVLAAVLRGWKQHESCSWVFPNSKKKPWTAGAPGYWPFDQLKALASRAGVDHANWKMFRHSFDTHGKGRFGMTREQMKNQLRHTTEDTQRHYDHDDLQNLRDAVRGIDFGKAVSADRAAEAPPPQ
jgi:integrase